MSLKRMAGFLLASLALAQSRIDLANQARNPDFSAMPHTRPIQVGLMLPSSCAVGELFFDASAGDGSAVFSCTATDVWTAVGSSGLGNCTVASNNLTCPGQIQTGTGATAGMISLYEPAINGSKSVAISAPDVIGSSYTLRLPGSGPQAGQTLSFTQPDSSGIAQGSWATAGQAGGTKVSLYATPGGTGSAISIGAPATLPTSYTLELPSAPPQSSQTLGFSAPDVNGVARASWQTPSGSQVNGGASLAEGTYGALPASCTEGSVYLFTDSLYNFARCTSGAWHHFFDGKAITPPSGLSVTTLVAQSQVALVTAHGYEEMIAPAGSQLMFRSFPAPVSAPYTKNLVFRLPPLLDLANYRLWDVGFGDPSGKTHVLTCGVGIAIVNGYWCRITRLDANGQGVAVDGANIGVPYLSGTIIVTLRNDGSLLHFGISAEGDAYFELGSVPATSFLSSPSRLVYGFQNSAAGQSLSLNFLGVY